MFAGLAHLLGGVEAAPRAGRTRVQAAAARRGACALPLQGTRHSANPRRSLAHPPALGFTRQEFGLRWYPTVEELFRGDPGPVLVGSAYEYEAQGRLLQARKYSAFECHEAFWERIEGHQKDGVQHNFHEIFPADRPRCLYFDLDGRPEYGDLHQSIMHVLALFVRWFFCGDRLGWSSADPEPVVLKSSDPLKYSCHVVFPQIHFKHFAQQCEFVRVLLNALPAVMFDLENGESVPILEHLVDRVPYSRFQLLRGPYASKLRDGRLRPETCLEPEGFFQGDPLACFAGHVDPGRALPLPTLQQVLEWNDEVRTLNEEHMRKVSAAWDRPWQTSFRDLSSLYAPSFQQSSGGGSIDFRGMTDLEQYEEALRWLHPDRASQWWTWFRVSGVTCRMLQRYSGNESATERIWEAHFSWSRRFPRFSEAENVEMVRRAEGRPVAGLARLLSLVRFDNPEMQVHTSPWQGLALYEHELERCISGTDE